MISERATAPAVGSVIAALAGDALLLRTAADDPAPMIRLTAALPVEPDRVTVLSTPAVTTLPDLSTLLPELLAEHLGGSAAGIRLLCLGTYAEPVAVDLLVRDLAERIGQEVVLPLDPCSVDDGGQPGTFTGGREWLSCAPGGTPVPEPEWPPRPPAPTPTPATSGDATTAPVVSADLTTIPVVSAEPTTASTADTGLDVGATTTPTARVDADRRAEPTADASVFRRPGIGQMAGPSIPRYLPYGGNRRRPGTTAAPPVNVTAAPPDGTTAAPLPGRAAVVPAVDSPVPVVVAAPEPQVAGRSTPAGWSFLAGDAPTVGMPLAAGFLVEVEIGATGFRVAGRPVPPAGLAKLIVAAQRGSTRPVVLLSSGTFPGGPAADLLFGGLADALGGTVYVADAAVSVTAHGLLVTEGQFRRWAPRSATPAAGPRHRTVGRVLPVPAGTRRRPGSPTAAVPVPPGAAVPGAAAPGAAEPEPDGSRADGHETAVPEAGEIGSAVEVPAAAAASGEGRAGPDRAESGQHPSRLPEPVTVETSPVLAAGPAVAEPVPVESVALLDSARWRDTPPALEVPRMMHPAGPLPVVPVPDAAAPPQAPPPTVPLPAPAAPVAYTGVARTETQAAARSQPVPDADTPAARFSGGVSFGDPGSPALVESVSLALVESGSPGLVDGRTGHQAPSPYGVDQRQPAGAGSPTGAVTEAEAVGGPPAPAEPEGVATGDRASIGNAQHMITATATPVALGQPGPETRPAAVAPAPFWLTEETWDPADRGRLRDALNGRYDAHVRVITRTLAEEPGMRAAGASAEMIAGLVALRAYHDGEREAVNRELRTGGQVEDGPAGNGESGERARLLARGAVHGLRRLPTVLGPVYASAQLPPPALAGYRPGVDVVEPAFLDVDLAAAPASEATVQFVIWSASARRLDRISPGDTAAALFPPGSRFAVLAVDRPDDDQEPIRVLLRDLAGQGVRGDRGVDRLLDRLRAARTPTTAVNRSRFLEFAPGLDPSGQVFAIPSQLVPSGAADGRSLTGHSGGTRT
ncbi:hypothetical protein [Micromonospora sp. NPDC004704]